MLKITQAKGNKAFFKLPGQWAKRLAAYSKMSTAEIAQQTLAKIVQKIPPSPDYRAYRRSLEVVEVAGKTKDHTTYAIWSKPTKTPKTRLPAEQADRMLIYVRHRRALRTPSAAVSVLVAHNPWTYNTMPFQPKKSEAVLDHRRVSKALVLATARQRQAEETAVREEFQKEGVKPIQDKDQISLKSSTANLTATQESTKLEFGSGASRAVPHWRPALRGIARKGILGMMRSKPKGRRFLQKLFTDPKLRVQTMTPRLRRISRSEARKFQTFAGRLGI